MTKDLHIGETYRHYKGGLFDVLCVALHEDTQEELVIYESLQDSGDFKKGAIWARPYKAFVEEIEVEGKKMPRFTHVKDASVFS